MRCGIAIHRDYYPNWDEARLYQRFGPEEARRMLQGYLREPGAILPYLEQVLTPWMPPTGSPCTGEGRRPLPLLHGAADPADLRRLAWSS